MHYLIYFLIAVTATGLGAMTGMGGGVIMKPALDMLGDYDAATVNTLSAITVLVMALVSATKQIRRGMGIDIRVAISLAIGSLLGGNVGQYCLALMLRNISSHNSVVIQNLCLVVIILFILIYFRSDKRPTLNMQGPLPALPTGIILGIISSFLGIGGGPFNVALILFVYACSFKEAVFYSIITILFAQASKLTVVAVSGTLSAYDLSSLPVLLTGAVLGSLAGSHFSRKLSEGSVQKLFTFVQVLVLFICMFNIYRNSSGG